MITCVAWVPRGAAAAHPRTAEPTEEELQAARELAERGGDDSDEAGSDEEEEDDEEEVEEEDDEEEGVDEAARGRARAVKQAKRMAAALAGAAGANAGEEDDDEDDDEELAELDMKHYDDGDEEVTALRRVFGGRGAARDRAFRSNKEDPYMRAASGPGTGGRGGRGSGGPADLGGDSDEDDDDSEAEDFTIHPRDLLLLAARNDEDVHNLEVWLYSEDATTGEANFYVHHDLLLPAFPLSVAWMDCGPGGAGGAKGSYAAVGTMSPGIEIWDLDVVDAVEPVATLGGEVIVDDERAAAGEGEGDDGEEGASGGEEEEDEEMEEEGRGGRNKGGKKGSGKAGKASKKAALRRPKPRRRLREGSHRDAVLALAWNPTYRNVLASGSADMTVKIWDVAGGRCDRTLTHHTGKVQALAWNPAEPTVLLSGGFDKTVALVDGRSPEAAALRWPLQADVEALAWDPAAPQRFYVSAEDGHVACYDARAAASAASLAAGSGGGGSKGGKAAALAASAAAAAGGGPGALFTLAAHGKPVCSLSLSAGCAGLLATGSTDKTAKLWDVRAATGTAAGGGPKASGAPELLASKNLKIGAVFSLGFSRDAAGLLGAGGSKGKVAVWDVSSEAAVAERWPDVLAAGGGA